MGLVDAFVYRNRLVVLPLPLFTYKASMVVQLSALFASELGLQESPGLPSGYCFCGFVFNEFRYYSSAFQTMNMSAVLVTLVTADNSYFFRKNNPAFLTGIISVSEQSISSMC